MNGVPLLLTVNRQMGTRVITRLVAHSDDATHPRRGLLRSDHRPAAGLAAAEDNPCLAPCVWASAEVVGQESMQMSLVQNDHVMQAFAANTPNEPFDVGVLPPTSWGTHDVFDPHMPHPLPKRGTVDRLPGAMSIISSWA
jgi:hypothetical protein